MKYYLASARIPFLCLLVWEVLFLSASGQEPYKVWEQHPWARFGVGSWKQVRVYREVLDETGKVESTSVADSKTTLHAVTDVDYSVQVDRTVEVAGKEFRLRTELLKQGFNGETNGQTVELQLVGQSEFEIGGRKYPVEVRRVVINGDELKRVSLIHYSETLQPHILKRETKVTDAAGVKPSFESFVEVLEVDKPYRVLSENKTVSHVKTIVRQADGSSTETVEVYCQDVPGGVVAHTMKEMDSAGRLVARSTLELTGYQVIPVSVEPVNSTTGRRRLFRSRMRGG